MDIFNLRDKLINDYKEYVESFIQIQDKRIKEYVEKNLEEGFLWPDPLIQMNPGFEPGERIDALVQKGILHHECSRIFRIKQKSDDSSKSLRLHKHQSDAMKAAKTGKNYILTTGTGSGKSLAYIVPIVDHVLRIGSGKGIQAIIIYPMNALCNSQCGELQKFLSYGYPKGSEPVRFARYTGQEGNEERDAIIKNPPDILLTNYVMAELILTRPYEKKIIQAARNLQFLVLDELHIYRGRQGADVSLLVRRLRDACGSPRLQCVGTSATLVTPGSYKKQVEEISRVATKIFGDTVNPEMVIGETLKKATPETNLSDPSFVSKLKERVLDPKKHPPKEYEGFVADPLSIWIEDTFGVAVEKESGQLVRANPKSLTGPDGAASALSRLLDVPESWCIGAIQESLLTGYECPDPDTAFPVFAFRLHQFISRGDNVYASLDPVESRHITVYGQQFVPGDRKRILLPIVFCRECGQEYYCVRVSRDENTDKRAYQYRDLSDRYNDDESEAGFLYYNPNNPWPEGTEEIIERLPDDWLDESCRLDKNHKKHLPVGVIIGTDGRESDNGVFYYYIKTPFRFCLNCGISYGAGLRSDITKLTSLGTEGRSTATTILSLSAIRHLKSDETLSEKAKKLLSFTDNRQDASLQAGHFNDFVEIGLLRSALYKAAKDAGPEGLSHDEITHKVFEASDLPLHLYASDPEVRFQALEETKKALKNVIGYRLYKDLKRGWRVTAPNLEQCGLLEIGYPSLKELCEAEEEWQGLHPAILTASPETRFNVCKVFLDMVRRQLAIKIDYLESQFQDRIQQQSSQKLIPPWALDENESMEKAVILYPRSKKQGDFGGNYYLSARSLFGQYLRRNTTFPDYQGKLRLDETQEIIVQLLKVLRVAGMMEEIMPARGKDDVPGYQLPGSAIRWIAGEGKKPFRDPLRTTSESEAGGKTNPFFVRFYNEIASEGKGIQAREHTAQVPYDLRIEREEGFREGRLPILFCSPTMELGIDIATLNLVNMRNIPPTPANYAQRSGRAGRSGQPALVFSYCSTGSPHDQYFFRRPGLMVSGAVSTPKLDLANEDLIKAHVHAIWLAATGQDLGSSLKDVLDLSGEDPSLDLQPHLLDNFKADNAKNRALQFSKNILSTIDGELNATDWYIEGWLEEILNKAYLSFDNACNRWRSLYRAAARQREIQHKIIMDVSRSPEDKKQAKRLRREAEAQLELLLDIGSVIQSDFYSYRYFASEGFLPGYNFPRLPLSAFIPGRKARRDDFLSRPRFLAISEFGPRSIVYHEGSRYIINKVIMPLTEEASEENIPISAAKLCPTCGYLHPLTDGSQGLDLCEYCKDPLDASFNNLFRLQNVSTKRRDRINCDEEERLRLGYEVRTGIRFSVHGGIPSYKTAILDHPEKGALASLTYGSAATLWRINLGWMRRKCKSLYGFTLDTERGYWDKSEVNPEEDDPDPMSASKKRVVPYVEDRKNCLLIQTAHPLDENQMASLQSALKQAIQTVYQLEENELAAEPLPDRENRKLCLLYEAAEGGAGVLRQLISDPDAFAAIAKEALDICHFDPETGEDRRRAPRAKEDCEAACYDCLMTYTNQRDHTLLDRLCIRDLLQDYARSKVSVSPGPDTREKHLQMLMDQSDTELERRWLHFINDLDLRLPTHAQKHIEACKTKPDFFYRDNLAAIYVDGLVHEYPERAERDAQQTDCLEDNGYTVVRFRNQDDWDRIVERFPHIFGTPKKST